MAVTLVAGCRRDALASHSCGLCACGHVEPPCAVTSGAQARPVAGRSPSLDGQCNVRAGARSPYGDDAPHRRGISADVGVSGTGEEPSEPDGDCGSSPQDEDLMCRPSSRGEVEPLVYDVPWLHADAQIVMAPTLAPRSAARMSKVWLASAACQSREQRAALSMHRLQPWPCAWTLPAGLAPAPRLPRCDTRPTAPAAHEGRSLGPNREPGRSQQPSARCWGGARRAPTLPEWRLAARWRRSVRGDGAKRQPTPTFRRGFGLSRLRAVVGEAVRDGLERVLLRTVIRRL